MHEAWETDVVIKTNTLGLLKGHNGAAIFNCKDIMQYMDIITCKVACIPTTHDRCRDGRRRPMSEGLVAGLFDPGRDVNLPETYLDKSR